MSDNTKHEQRTAKAKQRIQDWKDEGKHEDIVSGLGYRAMVVGVLSMIGIADAEKCLFDGVDTREACGLKVLDMASGSGICWWAVGRRSKRRSSRWRRRWRPTRQRPVRPRRNVNWTMMRRTVR